jgi:hypothetical protein
MLNPRDIPEGSPYGDSILDQTDRSLGRPRKQCFWGPFKSRGRTALDRAIVAMETSALVLIGCAIASHLHSLLR